MHVMNFVQEPLEHAMVYDICPPSLVHNPSPAPRAKHFFLELYRLQQITALTHVPILFGDIYTEIDVMLALLQNLRTTTIYCIFCQR